MLFATTDELKAHLGTVHRNLNFATLLSFVRQAEQQYLVPVLGAGLVRQLGNLPATGAPERLVRLREQFRPALAYYVVLEAAPMLAVSFGELGVSEASAQNAAPARQWVYYNFVEAAAASADRLLEIALAYLDERAGEYAAELDSAEFRARKRLFIASAAQLGLYVASGGSRRFFLALLPTLRQVEDFELADVLGEELLEQLREGLAGGEEPAAATRQLLGLVRPVVAHRALAQGILNLSVALAGVSLRLLSDNEAVRQRQAASPEAVSALSRQATAAADRYQARLAAHLDALRPAAAPVSAELRDNTGSATFWV